MSRNIRRLALLGGALSGWLCLACAPKLANPAAREPQVTTTLPSTFDASAPREATAVDTQNLGHAKWNDFFTDATVKGLIEVALKNNQELNVQLQDIIIAQTEIMARQGEYQPKVDAVAGAGIEKVGDRTTQGVSDRAHGVPTHLGNFAFGLRGSWEIDIWKRLRNATQAAKLRYLASVEGRNFIITQIVAEIVRSYYELLGVDGQFEVLQRNIDIQQNALEVVRLQKAAGRTTELAVQRFEAEVLKNRSRLFQLQQQRITLENRINFLLGRYPQTVQRNRAAFNESLPSVVKSGLPAELLNNRPDVRQAELQLQAAKLDVKIAKAGFYPSLSIEAGVGYETFNAAHLLATPASLAYNLAGNLVAPLINRKALKAQYNAANAAQLQAVFIYERAILQGFTDVVNQLAMIKNLQQSYDLQEQQVIKLIEAIEVSGILFQSAHADYMEVLLTRRDALDAEMELIETRKKRFLAIVNVYQALGGGWK